MAQMQMIDVYPNPGKGIYCLELINICPEEVRSIEISDPAGHTVRYCIMPGNSGMSKYRIDLKDAEAGIYLVNVITSSNTLISKIIRSR
jgi:hypothetical protein